MESQYGEHWTRLLEAIQSRRKALRRGIAATAGIGLLAGSAEMLAKKKHRKKRKKKKPPTCAELCGGTTCANCFYPPTGKPYCGHGYASQCVPCETDGDCLETPATPYCVARAPDPLSGEIIALCGLNGVCTNIGACPA